MRHERRGSGPIPGPGSASDRQAEGAVIGLLHVTC